MAAGLGRVLVLDRGALKDERWVFRQAEGRAREPQEGCLPLCAISFPSSQSLPFLSLFLLSLNVSFPESLFPLKWSLLEIGVLTFYIDLLEINTWSPSHFSLQDNKRDPKLHNYVAFSLHVALGDFSSFV